MRRRCNQRSRRMPFARLWPRIRRAAKLRDRVPLARDRPPRMPLYITGKVGKLCVADCSCSSAWGCSGCSPAVTVGPTATVFAIVWLRPATTARRRPSSSRPCPSPLPRRLLPRPPRNAEVACGLACPAKPQARPFNSFAVCDAAARRKGACPRMGLAAVGCPPAAAPRSAPRSPGNAPDSGRASAGRPA